jgi:hypothetical protein
MAETKNPALGKGLPGRGLLQQKTKAHLSEANQNPPSKTCLTQRQSFFCFVLFVATKKMTLLSGNPDGFAFILRLQGPTKRAQINNLLAPLQLYL